MPVVYPAKTYSRNKDLRKAAKSLTYHVKVGQVDYTAGMKPAARFFNL
jgi:hypothetical protein